MEEGPVDDFDQLVELERFWKHLVVPAIIPNFLQHFADITGDENDRQSGLVAPHAARQRYAVDARDFHVRQKQIVLSFIL